MPQDSVSVPSPSSGRRIVTILMIVVVICVGLVLGFIGLMTVLGNNVQETYYTLKCPEWIPEFSSEECEAWVNELRTTHRTDLAECERIAGKDTDPNTDAYECLREKGLIPGQ
jgi:hypothetical protein